MTDYEQFLEENGLTEADCERERGNISFIPFSKAERKHLRRGPSAIHGEGVFATTNRAKGYFIAVAKDRDAWTETGRYMNHSQTPNCYMTDGSGDFLFIFVPRRFIAEGEELTVDYRQVKEFLNGLHNWRDCVSSAI